MTPENIPRDQTKELISAPLVTSYNVKALIASSQFRQQATLPSGRTVSYASCGSKSGGLVVFFYGLGGSCRQIAVMHAQAVRLNIRLLCVDRPSTGFTDSVKSQRGRRRGLKQTSSSPKEEQDLPNDISLENDEPVQSSVPKKDKRPGVNERLDVACLDLVELVGLVAPDTKFGMMGHSCGVYYILRMLQLYPDQILDGPIPLLTPWVPFNECPQLTKRSLKCLKRVPSGVVWAVTSSMNHLGSMILASSNAISGTVTASHDLGSSKDDLDKTSDLNSERRPADPFVLQFSEAVDKVLLPALVQDMNRQHSKGYSAEIQLCVTDVGFDFASVDIPSRISLHAYCGHLDTMVPIEASRVMGKLCHWHMNEFKFSGHGGPRIFMTAMEDYALAILDLKACPTHTTEGSLSRPNTGTH